MSTYYMQIWKSRGKVRYQEASSALPFGEEVHVAKSAERPYWCDYLFIGRSRRWLYFYSFDCEAVKRIRPSGADMYGEWCDENSQLPEKVAKRVKAIYAQPYSEDGVPVPPFGEIAKILSR